MIAQSARTVDISWRSRAMGKSFPGRAVAKQSGRQCLQCRRADSLQEGCTWDGWETPEHWQHSSLDMAQKYVDSVLSGGTPWFMISGVPGSGKTRLCTTIFRAIVEGGKRGLYISWRDFARKAKSAGTDGDGFEAVVLPAKKTPVLYLDDFWKGSVNPADVNLAFELLNARYASQLPTILSSEHTLEAIIRGDEAIGSRLYEMSEGFYIDCSRAKNWRTMRRHT